MLHEEEVCDVFHKRSALVWKTACRIPGLACNRHPLSKSAKSDMPSSYGYKANQLGIPVIQTSSTKRTLKHLSGYFKQITDVTTDHKRVQLSEQHTVIFKIKLSYESASDMLVLQNKGTKHFRVVKCLNIFESVLNLSNQTTTSAKRTSHV